MLYDRAEAKNQVARKKVAKVGKKIVRPGTATGKQTAAEDEMTRLRLAHKKVGSMDSAAALIAARRRRTG